MDNPTGLVRHLLLIRVPRETEIAIEDRFLELAGTTKPGMGYHITLVGPYFLGANDTEEALQEMILKLCASIDPMRIDISGLGVFVGKGHTLYLEVAPSPALTRLWQHLRKHLGPHIGCQYDHYDDEADYRPHITLGIGLTDAELCGLETANRDTQFDAHFCAKAIGLARQEPNSPWEHIHSFPLGQPSILSSTTSS